jgi:hypothetical protein
MQIEGNLHQFPLSELIALMAGSSATGVLEIGEHGRLGRIFCRSSRVYHAEAGAHAGIDAIALILQAGDAPFRFISGVRHTAKTLWPDPQIVIGYTRRYEHLHRQVRRYIPTLDYIPILRASSDDADIRLSSAIWPALALVDGQRSVAEIAALLVHEPLEIGLMFSELIARGLIAIEPPQRAAPPADASQPKSPPSSTASLPNARAATGGFFEWVLTGRPDKKPTAWFFHSLALFGSLLVS